MLEGLCHDSNIFATLTYAPKYLPKDGSLQRQEMTNWLKLFREHLRVKYQRFIRFYLVGEYGDLSWRPHYHMALFSYGYPGDADLLAEFWKKGFVHIGGFSKDSAGYISGYVVKKLTSANNPLLKGKAPEYSTSSNRPGLGANYVPYLRNALSSQPAMFSISSTGDVPTSLLHDGRRYPLGRYMRRKLRESLGFQHLGSQPGVVNDQEAQMSKMYFDFLNSPEIKTQSFQEFLTFNSIQRVATDKARFQLFNKAGIL